MTEQEKELLGITVNLWNAFLALPVEHPSDRAEFCQNLHVLQNMILARPTRREVNETTGRGA
jgi:hypothetical protein